MTLILTTKPPRFVWLRKIILRQRINHAQADAEHAEHAAKQALVFRREEARLRAELCLLENT
jgi:hypothetical protein